MGRKIYLTEKQLQDLKEWYKKKHTNTLFNG